MYAIIETGGKQYKVSEGDVIFVEKLEAEEGASVSFDKVLAVGAEDGLKVGDAASSASVSAKVLKNGKYKPKKGYRRKQGHRQPFTKVQIEKING